MSASERQVYLFCVSFSIVIIKFLNGLSSAVFDAAQAQSIVAEVVVEAEREASVLSVLDVDVGQLFLRLAEREVALEVDEARLDGFYV